MNILINFATRSRPTQFSRVMNRLQRLTSGKLTVLLKVDTDDKSMNSRGVQQYLRKFKHPVIFSVGDRVSKIHAINRDIDKAGEWDVLVNISDDMTPILHRWDEVMKRMIQATWLNTDFFAHFSDGHVKERLCTLSILGREYYERDKYVYYPGYKSFSCDAEAMYVAMMRGRHEYFSQTLFIHDHPANSRLNKNDGLYRENSKFSDADTKLYFERLNQYFFVPEEERCCVPFQQYMNAL